MPFTIHCFLNVSVVIRHEVEGCENVFKPAPQDLAGTYKETQLRSSQFEFRAGSDIYRHEVRRVVVSFWKRAGHVELMGYGEAMLPEATLYTCKGLGLGFGLVLGLG